MAAGVVNESTLRPALLPLSPAWSLLQRLPDAISELLSAHHVPESLATAEHAEALEQRLGPTDSRSLVGSLSEFGFLADAHRSQHGDPCNLLALALDLSRTPCGPEYRRHVSLDRELAAVVAQLRPS